MLLLGILAALLMLVHPPAVSAACLLGDYSVPTEFERSVAVLVGTVVDERAIPEAKNLYEGVTYSVKTDETLRGKLPAIVELLSENSSGRFPMAKGQKYVLFIYQVADRLAVDNCGNSGPLAEKENVLNAVRQLAKVTHGSEKPN
jgi:hypothetical protein